MIDITAPQPPTSAWLIKPFAEEPAGLYSATFTTMPGPARAWFDCHDILRICGPHPNQVFRLFSDQIPSLLARLDAGCGVKSECLAKHLTPVQMLDLQARGGGFETTAGVGRVSLGGIDVVSIRVVDAYGEKDFRLDIAQVHDLRNILLAASSSMMARMVLVAAFEARRDGPKVGA